MNNPVHLYPTGSTPTAPDTQVGTGLRDPSGTGHPTPESVGFEIGVILTVALGVAYAVPLVLSVCGIE